MKMERTYHPAIRRIVGKGPRSQLIHSPQLVHIGLSPHYHVVQLRNCSGGVYVCESTNGLSGCGCTFFREAIFQKPDKLLMRISKYFLSLSVDFLAFAIRKASMLFKART